MLMANICPSKTSTLPAALPLIVLTFDNILVETVDELFPPFLLATLLLRCPIADFEFRQFTGEIENSDGNDFRFPLQAQCCTVARHGRRRTDRAVQVSYRSYLSLTNVQAI